MSPLPAPIWLLTARKGNAAAWALATLNEKVRALGRTLRRQHPQSEATETRLELQATGPFTRAGLGQIARILDDARIDHDVRLDASCDGHCALSLPSFTVNPFGLVRALAAEAERRGALICEHTKVASVVQDGAGARVTLSSGGVITARTAVICTNAYTDALSLPQGARRAKVIRNYMLATAPLDAAMRRRLGDERRFVVELNKSYVFFRLHQGRMVYGGIESFTEAGGSDFAVPDKIRQGLEALMRASLGTASPAIEHAWSGRYHSTLTEMPIIGRHPRAPAIVMNVGYGGTGVALTQVFSERAAALALGQTQTDPDAARLGQILHETRLPIGGLMSFGCGVARQLLLGGGATDPRSQSSSVH